ncbi:hypothetical protein M407DRAFT_3653 [Tulasnella calospora MUT 4182]|uniref:Meiotically up-regulated Mug190 protein third C2 domain-containing protein n=1 Tax=Tulasnella calospora MUT 4182 TaxID=1051891 RepID=A0A0C3MKI9_9AGAM|nr:hypothetical protein M407DRAFT_3653 [Tulasnella calospora MUT 4182]
MSTTLNTQFGDPYSERNKVSNIAKYKADRQKNEPPADAQKPGEDVPQTGKEEKDAIMKRSQGKQAKPTDEVEEQRKKGPRMVRDPVTGQTVLVKDAKLEDYQAGKLSHLDPNDPKAGPATQAAGDGAVSADKPAPNPAHPGNVLIHSFPPPVDVSLGPFMSQLDRLMYVIIGGSVLLWFFTALGHGWKHFFWNSFYISAFAFGATTLASLAQRGVEKEVERVRANMHRERGQKFSPPTPESVEWLNAFLQTVWGLINPDMFVTVADTVEDVMQQSLPGFIDAVRISDIGQGTNPLRIVSMRALPDKPGDKEYPRDEWINQGMPPDENVHSNQVSKETEQRELNGGDDGSKMEQSGDYVNYEVAVSYQALPGQGKSLRSKNIHLLLEFFLGAFDWLHIPIPIWVQVEGIAATVRLRIQFIPEPPFVRNELPHCRRANISLLFRSVKLKLPRPALGWDTATVEINKPLTLSIQDKSKAGWLTKGTNIVVSTTDSTDHVSKAQVAVDSATGKLTWEFDQLRLPVYTRYASSVYFEFGTGGLFDRKPDAIAVLWLNDVVDDQETMVEIPVVVGKDLKQLRQNFLDDFAKKTHDYQVIGTLKVQIRVDAGLDMDHEKNAKSQARRHAFEAYDHIEGEAQVAERLAHADDDGVIDKQERKSIKAAHDRQLENRQRGVAGYKPYRTMKWIKQGIKGRIHPDKPAKREPNVNTEA